MRAELRAYLRADNALRDMREARDKAFRIAYPIGYDIEWKRGGYLQQGTVVMHGHADSLKALNKHTGKEVWISGYDIQLASN